MANPLTEKDTWRSLCNESQRPTLTPYLTLLHQLLDSSCEEVWCHRDRSHPIRYVRDFFHRRLSSGVARRNPSCGLATTISELSTVAGDVTPLRIGSDRVSALILYDQTATIVGCVFNSMKVYEQRLSADHPEDASSSQYACKEIGLERLLSE